MAMPLKDTPDMADDPQLREMTLDPKHRRVLVTDGRSAVGQAVVHALAKAGAAIIFVGVADAWKRFAGSDALRSVSLAAIEVVAVADASIGGLFASCTVPGRPVPGAAAVTLLNAAPRIAMAIAFLVRPMRQETMIFPLYCLARGTTQRNLPEFYPHMPATK